MSVRRLIPNGCGPAHARVVSDLVADEIGTVDWSGCCNWHDAAYWQGGVLGGLLPWNTEDGFEWRYMKANVGLAACMWRRWGKQAKAKENLLSKALYRVGQGLLPLGYGLATTLLGWTAWSRKKRTLSQAQLASLEGLTGDDLRRLEGYT